MEHFASKLRCTILQNAVHLIDELCFVKGQADWHKTQSDTMLNYEQCFCVLLSTATSYNTQFATTKKSGCCAVYMHDIIDPDPDPEHYDHDQYDSDSCVDSILANFHSHQSSMP
jgi:hypothetical protein